MKREGRQHGMVRSYEIWIPPTTSTRFVNKRVVNKTESPATAGLFTKVSSKPTNHSKFTGKCGRTGCLGCHDHPVSKSKGKVKGTQKERTFVEHEVGARYAGLRSDLILCDLDTGDDVFEYYDDEGEELEFEQQDNVYNREEVEEEDDDGRMSFCEVTFVLDLEDEGWCMVGEM